MLMYPLYRSVEPIQKSGNKYLGGYCYADVYSYIAFLSDFRIDDTSGLVLGNDYNDRISSESIIRNMKEKLNRYYSLGKPITEISDAFSRKDYEYISYVFDPTASNSFPVQFRMGHFENSYFIAKNLCRFFLSNGTSEEFKFAYAVANSRSLLVFNYESDKNHSLIMNVNGNFNNLNIRDLDGLQLFTLISDLGSR